MTQYMDVCLPVYTFLTYLHTCTHVPLQATYPLLAFYMPYTDLYTQLLPSNHPLHTNQDHLLPLTPSDDKSMSSITVTGSALVMTPKQNSYFYENFPCENTVAAGYGSFAFTLSGPAQASFLIELQTRASCTDTAVKRSYHNVTVPTTSTLINVPLAEFADANLAAVTSFVMSTFNKTGPYTISNLHLACK